MSGSIATIRPSTFATRLVMSKSESMRNVSAEIKARQIGHFTQADPAYAAQVAAKFKELGG